MSRLQLVPITIREANRYVARWHRHARPTHGGICAIGAQRPGAVDLCGVAIIGRPVARLLDNGRTCEVTRLATDGSDDVCSWLYQRCRRIAQAMGYARCVTYTLARESGASLRALGLQPATPPATHTWERPNRERTHKHRIEPRQRWELLPDASPSPEPTP
ncbi:MAG TPA: XF1762 family protein [Longimicrobiaceae bacterium]